MKKENNGFFLIILLFIGVVLVFLFPRIYSSLESTNFPEIEKSKEEVVEDKKEITEELLSEIHTPLMRNSIYSDFTYYSLDVFKVSDMKNSDIIYNAFADMYEGNITDSSYNSKCGSVNKEFNAKYIELRIKNILGRDTNYELENFYVPEDSNSSYKGNWVYSNSKYYYDGICENNNTSVRYYDLKELISAKYGDTDDNIIVTYYVGFAKVEDGQYKIYSDAHMSDEISNGSFSDLDSLEVSFSNIDKSKKKVYEFTYNNTICTYDEYCMYEGKWLNE